MNIFRLLVLFLLGTGRYITNSVFLNLLQAVLLTIFTIAADHCSEHIVLMALTISSITVDDLTLFGEFCSGIFP